MRNGYGVKNWINGDRYEGNWVKDIREGKGIFYWANGNTYDGDWLNGRQHG